MAGGDFVGREQELSALLTLLEDARAGFGGAALVVGEAGIGKTRLTDELCAEAVAGGVTVCVGRCWEAGGAPPFWPWIEVLRALPGGTEALAAARDGNASSDQARFALFEAVCAVLVDAARVRPLLVVLDDVHAADTSSLLLLEFVARAARTAALLVVAAYREEDVVRVAGGEVLDRLRRGVRQVRLAGLDLHETRALLVGRTGQDPEPEVVEGVWKSSGGNPFFITELAGLSPGAPMPVGVRQAVVRRLVPYPSRLTELLSVAAVGGRRLDPAILSEVSGIDVLQVLEMLDEGLRAGLLTRSAPEGEIRFVHILLRDALLESLATERRLRLHASFADALAARNAHLGDEHLAEVAHHHRASLPLGDVAAALRTTLAAGRHSLAALAYEDAAAQFERALDLVHDAVGTIDVLLALGGARSRAGGTEGAGQAFERAARMARSLGDRERFATAVLGLAEKIAFQRADPGIVGVLREAVDGLDPGPLLARLLARLARALVYCGETAASVPVAERAVEVARGSGNEAVLADALHAQQVALWRPDTVVARLAAADELVALATAAGTIDLAADAQMWRLIAHLQRCDIGGVDRAIEGYAALADQSRQPRHRFVAASRQAMRAYLAGRLEEGDALAEQARAVGLAAGEPDADIVFHGLRVLPYRNANRDLGQLEEVFRRFSAQHTSAGSRCLLALFALERGAEAEAQAHLQALTADDVAAVPRDMDALLCWSLLAEVAARVGDVASAAALYPRLAPFAGHAAQVAGAVSFAGAVDHYLGMLARLLGRPAVAARHLADARRLHAAMGAGPWLERTVAEESRLQAPPPSAPAERVVALRADGRGIWTIGAPGATFELPDTKGLRLLARLLAEPGRELHVLDLDGRVAEAGTGPLLDEQARSAYRRRIRELREEIDDTRERGDLGRVELAEAELDALTAQVAQAVGLGGRDRIAGSAAERARIAVRKAIAGAIRRIGERDGELQLLLTSTVRTGTYCSYVPDPRWPVRWQV